MADISVQFHCLPDELILPVFSFVNEVRAHVVAIRLQPFDAVLVAASDLSKALHDPAVRRIVFTAESPVLGAKAMSAFLDQNPGALMLDLGRRIDAGLKESWLTSRTDNPVLLASWRKLLKQVRFLTRAGAIALNPQTGATSRLKDHRYSVGAKLLESQGVPMLPAAGTARLHFPEWVGM